MITTNIVELLHERLPPFIFDQQPQMLMNVILFRQENAFTYMVKGLEFMAHSNNSVRNSFLLI